MKEQKKIPLVEVERATNRQFSQLGRKGISTMTFETLFYGWMHQKRFLHPTQSTSRHRIWRDGYFWLKESEMQSFIDYATE